MEKPRISVIGTGYVGLGTALSFASRGYSVIASDSDTEKVNHINQGLPPFHEPEFPEALTKALRNKNFKCLNAGTQKAIRNRYHFC